MIEIWGKANCPSCMSAKLLCETRNLDYIYKQLDIDFSRDDVLEEFPGARTFPQIKVGGDKIGGYEKLTSYIEETGYNGTGWSL